MYQELNAIVLPGGTMNMEWTDTGEQISKSSHLLQQEIYRRFTSDSETALLFLGFCDRAVPLSASLSFWRGLTGLFAGTVEDFIKTFSPDVHLVGRVFFHLVESKKDDYPFAFLATYSTGLSSKGTSKHLPLKYALEEFGRESGRLLGLLSHLHIAAKESPLIEGLLETGGLFHPLAWSAQDAFNFLEE